jgi:pyrrolidone-carboxylate peptidase
MILVYSFFSFGNTSYRFLRNLDVGERIKKYYLGNINSLVKHIVNNKYRYILGLGDSSRVAKRIKIEKVFGNRYHKGEIVKNGKDSYCSNWNLPTTAEVVNSDKVTNASCNRSGYLIMKAIEENNLPTRFAFMHVPRGYKEIDKLLHCYIVKLYLIDNIQ